MFAVIPFLSMGLAYSPQLRSRFLNPIAFPCPVKGSKDDPAHVGTYSAPRAYG